MVDKNVLEDAYFEIQMGILSILTAMVYQEYQEK